MLESRLSIVIRSSAVVKENKRYDLRYFVFDEICEEDVVHGFTTRFGGVSEGNLENMNMSFSRGDAPENVVENYRRIAETLGVEAGSLVLSKQVHGTNVRRVTDKDKGKGIYIEDASEYDAMVTNCRGVTMATIHADCVPVFFVGKGDKGTEAVGLAHSGWKGTLNGICGNVVDNMKAEYDIEPSSIKAVIGPCICKGCFEVRKDTLSEFETKLNSDIFEKYCRRKGAEHWTIDLKGIIKENLLEKGIGIENIKDTGYCTMCDTIFYSHRREKGATGAMAALIALK